MSSTALQTVLVDAITAARFGFEPEQELAVAIVRGGESVRLADLGFDSLAWMEFCISVELNTGAELTPDHLDACETLADVAAWIREWRKA